MDKYILLLNDGVMYDYGKNVFSYKGLKSIFREELEKSGVEKVDLMSREGEFKEDLSIEESIEMLIEDKYECYDMFVEMGDDFSKLRVVKIEE